MFIRAREFAERWTPGPSTGHAAVIALVFFLASAALGTPAITFTGGTATTTFANNGTFGFDFRTGGSPFTIDSLGVWDQDGNGLFEAHQVGTWDSTGTSLLVSATVPAGTVANLGSQFRFVRVSPTVLPANTQFLAGEFFGSNSDAIIRHMVATTVSAITRPIVKHSTLVCGDYIRCLFVLVALVCISLWAIPAAMDWYYWRCIRATVTDTMADFNAVNRTVRLFRRCQAKKRDSSLEKQVHAHISRPTKKLNFPKKTLARSDQPYHNSSQPLGGPIRRHHFGVSTADNCHSS